MIWRLILLGWAAIDLSGDEAYYWEWGRRLDWGYFSKPPGIGWVMHLAGRLGGHTEFGLRAAAVLFGTGAILLVYSLAGRLYGERAGLLAALAFTLNPANAALNLVLTIDAPLLFFWVASLWAFWRCVERDFRSPSMALVLAVAAGCGLLMKQIMLAFFPAALLALSLDAAGRKLLRRPWLWLSLVLSHSFWIPALVWNAQHEWITWGHTLHHFEPAPKTLPAIAGRSLEFLGLQLGLVTPILGLLIVLVLVLVVRSWGTLSLKEKLLFCWSGPGLAVMFLLCTRQRVNGNWPAVFYPAACVLLAGWAAAAWSSQTSADRCRRFFRPGLALGAALTALGYASLLALSAGWIQLGSADVTSKIRGWSRIAADVALEQEQMRATLPDREDWTVVTQSHRFLTSQLAFYLPGQPAVYRHNPSGRKESQYDLWPGPTLGEQKSALIVIEGGQAALSPQLASCFRAIEFRKTLEYPGGKGRLKVYSIFLGKGLHRWP